ncbi:MAG: hypothetical protein H9W81_07655 [Enterococcus sp.]|nr:hypothetical protein [Enterococcus sp.]
MELANGTTKKDISFRNRQTGRHKVLPKGQTVRIRDTFAQGNAYTLTTTYKGDSYEVNGILARDIERD